MTLIGQKPNTIETQMLERVINRIIPCLQIQQLNIAKDYIDFVESDDLTRIFHAGGRRGGVTTIANVIAMAESHLGNNVIFVGETIQENRACIRKLCDFSPLGNAAFNGKVRYHSTKHNIKGQRCDILIHETFFHLKSKDIIQKFHDMIATTNPSRAYMIHA